MALEPLDILGQRREQSLGMMRGQDDAAANLGLVHSWHHLGKVDHKFNGAVVDDRKVGVDALGEVFWQIDVDFGGFWVLLI